MPVSIIIGGQLGSEAKGKVALQIARDHGPEIIAVRVGGPNSGHIAYDRTGTKHVFRQIPVCAVDGASYVVLPPGSYLDVPLLLREAAELGLTPDRLVIDHRATIITDQHREWERDAGLTQGIGSTGSGTGAAVMAAAGYPDLPHMLARDIPELQPYLANTLSLFREQLETGRRVVVEGTQGFGLSILHGPWPKVTSRDTTAAAVLAECGLSPFDVDDITLVLRCHPIRVAGDSGPLVDETDWETIAQEAGAGQDVTEMTTVTGKVRRVGRFDADLVRRAIAVNGPTRIVLNHLDYVDWRVREGALTDKAVNFVRQIEASIEAKIDWVGINERELLPMTS